MKTPLLNSPELFEQLFQLCRIKKTGTFFIAIDDKTSCQLTLKEGVVITAVYNNRFMGFEALEKIKMISAGRYSFSENLILPTVEAALIEHTHDVLTFLGFDRPEIKKLEHPEDEIVYTYRGQKIIKMTTKEPSSVQPLTKPKRIYRGQVVQD